MAENDHHPSDHRDGDDPSTSFRKKLKRAINECSMENGSDTPDFILAEYLLDCLQAFDYAQQRRTDWYSSQRDAK